MQKKKHLTEYSPTNWYHTGIKTVRDRQLSILLWSKKSLYRVNHLSLSFISYIVDCGYLQCNLQNIHDSRLRVAIKDNVNNKNKHFIILITVLNVIYWCIIQFLISDVNIH